MSTAFWIEAEVEGERARWRRRIQQRRCLVCGSRDLVNQGSSYFCAEHLRTHRWCGLCETLRPLEAHGLDCRCRTCSTARSLAYHRANTERTAYRQRLRDIARRRHTRGEQILVNMRRRIALAAFVAATPGMSWAARGRLLGAAGRTLAEAYRAQCRGRADVDAADTARPQKRPGREG